MRLNAYVLAGDPAWIPESLGAYYPLVDRIVVSFDSEHRSWSGAPLSVGAAIARLREIDAEDKIRLLPGRHSDPQRNVLDVETEQRQAALDAASEGADWVIQLDTDEILLDLGTFVRCLTAADHSGASALDYPMRDFYQHLRGDRFLEHSRRLWGDRAAYPGPVAVRVGTPLNHCRQTAADAYRVDFRRRNTDPWHPRNAPVHRTIHRRQGIAHMSWVRTSEQMAEKSRTSGYSRAYDWQEEIAKWEWRRTHPWLTVAATPFRTRERERFRLTRLRLGSGPL